MNARNHVRAIKKRKRRQTNQLTCNAPTSNRDIQASVVMGCSSTPHNIFVLFLKK